MCPFDDEPSDVVKPKAIALWYEHEKLKAEHEALRARVAELEQQNQKKNKRLFGPSSERSKPTDDVSATTPQGPASDRKKGHGRRPQPHLETVEQEHPVPDEEGTCSVCGGTLQDWEGQDEESVEIDVEPRRYVKRVHKRKKRRCRCGACIKTAPAPAKLKEGNGYSIAFGIDVAVDKYAHHLPLERQVKAMRQHGLDVDSQTLWDQADSVAFWCIGAYRALGTYVLSFGVVCGDETSWRLMAGKKGETGSQKWWVWIARVPNAVYYTFEDSRSADAGGKLFDGFMGVVMCDGYAVYTTLAKRNPNLLLAHCWSHIRRDYLDIASSYPAETTAMVSLINELFRIEREAPKNDPAALLALRNERSQPVLERILEKAFEIGLSNSKESRLFEATRTMVLQWEGLTRFVNDARIPIHNNHAEQSARAPVIGRKNHYGSRSKRGTEVAAILYTLIESAKLFGVDPRAYLHLTVLRALRGESPVLPHEVTAALLMEWLGLSEERAKAALRGPPPVKAPSA